MPIHSIFSGSQIIPSIDADGTVEGIGSRVGNGRETHVIPLCGFYSSVLITLCI